MASENVIHRKLSRGYQITLPSKFRNKMKLDVGKTVSMKMEGEKLVIEPFYNERDKAVMKLQSIFSEIDSKEAFVKNEEEAFKVIKEERVEMRNKRRK